MKKIIYILAISLVNGFFISCTSEDEDTLFNKSAETRVQEKLQEYRNILTSSENGWYGTYIPFQSGPEVKLWFSFNENGRVTTWSDMPSGTYINPITKKGVFEKDETNYRVGIHQAPDLIFEDFMVLSNIAIQNNGSFSGEYEFEFVSASQDSVVLRSSLELNTTDRTQFVLYPATTDSEGNIVEQGEVADSYSIWKEQMDVFLEINPEYATTTADEDYINSKYIYAFVKNNTAIFIMPDFETHGIYIGKIGTNEVGRYIPYGGVYRSIFEIYDGEWVLNVPFEYSISNSSYLSEVNTIDIGALIPLVYVTDGDNSGYEILN
ncbi:MAG: DUF4302 domain-containing protein [Flavobacteriaceae bacterium]